MGFTQGMGYEAGHCSLSRIWMWRSRVIRVGGAELQNVLETEHTII